MYVMVEIKCTNTTLPRNLNFDIDNLKVLAQEFPALPTTDARKIHWKALSTFPTCSL